MSPSSNPGQYKTTPDSLVELRRWAYEQTGPGTTERRLKDAEEILNWLLTDPDETDEG